MRTQSEGSGGVRGREEKGREGKGTCDILVAEGIESVHGTRKVQVHVRGCGAGRREGGGPVLGGDAKQQLDQGIINGTSAC